VLSNIFFIQNLLLFYIDVATRTNPGLVRR